MSKRVDNDSYASYTNPITSTTPTDACADLSFPTDLKKHQQVGLSKAHPGDVFPIRLDAAGTPWVYNFAGEPCGIIVSLQSPQLVECLRQGKAFGAAILRITQTACAVLVQPARP